MEPTLQCGGSELGCTALTADRVVAREPPGSIERGDIVVYRMPPAAVKACGGRGLAIGRVVGLPNEVFAERHGFVYIDGKLVREPYVPIRERDSRTRPGTETGDRGYMVLGDDRIDSCDSVVWGVLPGYLIIGKIVRVIRA